MIIVDTSIWVDHFRRRDAALQSLIADGEVLLHPFVLGELLLGGLPARGEVADVLREMAVAPVGSTDEVNALIDWAKLAGSGVGYVDTHLFLSARLVANGAVLTGDKRLLCQAKKLGVAHVL